MKEVKVVGYKEVGFDFDICNEIYEDGVDRVIDCQLLDVELLNIMFEDRLEWEESVEKKEVISNMISNISELDDDVLVEF
tara:strand:- start:733 stop:972 length:240 start_codon:yes stop_codon:yes gene_type:complete